MCWPVDRSGTHAAGGPAARGGLVFVFSLRIAPVSGSVLTTGVVIRRRAVSGEGVKESPRDSDGKTSPPCGGDSGMTMGDSFAVYSDDYCESMCWPVDRPATHAAAGAAARGRLVFRATCRLRRGRHEGVSFFVWRLLRCRRGILSYAQEQLHEGVFWRGGFLHTLESGRTRKSKFLIRQPPKRRYNSPF